MPETLNLYQKLSKIRNMSSAVEKTKSGYNYKYADLPTVLANVTAGMEKYGVSLIPIIRPGTMSIGQNVIVKTKADKSGKTFDATTTEMLVGAEMIYRWVNDETPSECIDVPWYLTGSQEDPSQALGSALTYTTRYFLINYFGIAQLSGMDVDEYRSKQKEAQDQQDAEVSAAIVQEIDNAVRSYLKEKAEKKDEVQEFMKARVARGNYLAIKDPIKAAEVLREFTEKFSVEGN